MGSLMAGWSSHALDPKSERYRRNKSLTKEDIEAYWKLKKKTEEEHLEAISRVVSETSSRRDALTETEQETRLENVINSNAWWTRSSSAFLNEPPVIQGQSDSYSSQFHVANLSKFHLNHGISAK